MRINRFVAFASGMSRRTADKVIEEGRVQINTIVAQPGMQVSNQDTILLDNKSLALPLKTVTIILNKPAGYVCSRQGQGSKTIYDLIPDHLHELKPIGRLDKDSSGLLLLTNDGELAHQLTHPRFQKTKIYEIKLNKQLEPLHQQMIAQLGVQLDDGPSKLGLDRVHQENGKVWRVTMHEGRNRQIRRTFSALGYNVISLNRIQFGNYSLSSIKPGSFRQLSH